MPNQQENWVYQTNQTQARTIDIAIQAFRTGQGGQALYNYLRSIGSSVEVISEILLRIYILRENGVVDINYSLQVESMLMQLVEELEGDTRHNEKLPHVLCERCQQRVISQNKAIRTNIMFGLTASGMPKIKSITICGKCNLESRRFKCQAHGYLFLPELAAKCPLYDRCTPKLCCSAYNCVEHHTSIYHPKYQKRDWKKTNKFASKAPGEIITSDIKVGVEYEAVGLNYDTTRHRIFKLDRNIGLGTDLSIRDFPTPIELQTPPASGKKLEKLVKDVCRVMKESKFVTNLKCGTHIHIDSEGKFGTVSKNPLFFKNLFAAYIYFEPIFFALTPENRMANRFAQPLYNHYGKYLTIDKYRDELRRKMFSKIWYGTEDKLEIERFKKEQGLSEAHRASGSIHHWTKYMWVNFHSMFRKQGIEIRSLEGNLDSELSLRWIQLHQSFMEAVAAIGFFFPDEYKMKERKSWTLSVYDYEPELFDKFMALINADEPQAKWIEERLYSCEKDKRKSPYRMEMISRLNEIQNTEVRRLTQRERGRSRESRPIPSNQFGESMPRILTPGEVVQFFQIEPTISPNE